MRIAIVEPNLGTVSETFIRAHAKHLPGEVTLLQSLLPRIHGRPVLDGSLGTMWHLGLCMARGIRPRGDWAKWASTCAFLKAFRRLRPDVVLAEYGPTAVALREVCQRLRIPLVAHFHGYDAAYRPLLDEMQTAYPQMFAAAAAIVAVSVPMQEALIRLGAPEHKIHYNPYGVECDRFDGADPARAAPTFLAVGRLVAKKAPHLTLLAFEQVHRQCPDAKLRVIGAGGLLSVCQDLTRILGLQSAVTFLGPQPQDVVRRELQQSRAFVQHSVTTPDGDAEGLPVAVLEAGASGLPVIATRHAGIPAAVLDGQTGFLVEEGDFQQMAQHMAAVYRDTALAARMGQAGQAHVRANFSMPDRIARLAAILDVAAAVPPQVTTP
jgi:colanic acid/amylovoran biosynthesis glycosyltransferase